MKETKTKHIRKVGRWAFAICAGAVTIIACIKGDLAYACWPILSAGFHWAAGAFEDLSESAIEYGDAMAQANIEMSNELVKAQLQVVELQEELNRLKK